MKCSVMCYNRVTENGVTLAYLANYLILSVTFHINCIDQRYVPLSGHPDVALFE